MLGAAAADHNQENLRAGSRPGEAWRAADLREQSITRSSFSTYPALVAMLGLGVAEHTGFISASLRSALSVTPKCAADARRVIFVGIFSHVAVDAGYVLVIPLGGGDLLRRGAASAGRHRGGVRRRVGRILAPPCCPRASTRCCRA